MESGFGDENIVVVDRESASLAKDTDDTCDCFELRLGVRDRFFVHTEGLRKELVGGVFESRRAGVLAGHEVVS
jgi:hypothetical protein